jgi:hypothetical protein
MLIISPNPYILIYMIMYYSMAYIRNVYIQSCVTICNTNIHVLIISANNCKIRKGRQGNGRVVREGREDKGRAARQGESGKAREGRQGEGRAARQARQVKCGKTKTGQ